MKHAVLIASTAALLAACVEVVDGGLPPECVVTSDCSGAEVCDEGVCWGDPPAGELAVVLSPPGSRTDLVPTEITDVRVDPDGWLEPMATAWPRVLHGRIEAVCDGCTAGMTVPATVTVRRPSRIPGGEPFLVSTFSLGGTVPGDSFSLSVPAWSEGEPPYVVTIQPSESQAILPSGRTPAELVPPVRFQVTEAQLDDGLLVTLDADTVRVVRGQIKDANGEGVGGYRVYANGRVDPLLPLERVSTVAYTGSDGNFVLLLGTNALDVIDIVARPPEGAIVPTLIAHDRYVDSSETLVLELPNATGATSVTVPVVHTDTAGVDLPVPNARVELSTVFIEPTTPWLEAVFWAEGPTDDSGHFTADVIAGTSTVPRTYSMRITPPTDAITASYAAVVEVAVQGGQLPTVHLSQRTTLTGVILDADGLPVEGVTVKAAPSLFFLWSLDADAQAIVEDRGRPQTVTNPDGTFTIWVDPAAAGVAASYDLEVEPPDFSSVPRAVIPDVDGSMSHDLGFVTLPERAHVRGVVTDPDGNALGDAGVKVYSGIPDLDACVAQNAPSDCQPPARILGTGTSATGDGVVRLTLPR